MHGLHAATSNVVNSAQGSSCKLKFVHVVVYNVGVNKLVRLSLSHINPDFFYISGEALTPVKVTTRVRTWNQIL